MADDARQLAATVRQRRKELRLTQDDLADLSGTSPRFIRELEAGKAGVRLDKLLDVLTALGLLLEIARRSR